MTTLSPDAYRVLSVAVDHRLYWVATLDKYRSIDGENFNANTVLALVDAGYLIAGGEEFGSIRITTEIGSLIASTIEATDAGRELFYAQQTVHGASA